MQKRGKGSRGKSSNILRQNGKGGEAGSDFDQNAEMFGRSSSLHSGSATSPSEGL